MAAAISTASGYSVTSRQVLFSVAGYGRDVTHSNYAVAPGNQRFAMVRTAAFASGDLVLIENWFEVLKEKLRR